MVKSNQPLQIRLTEPVIFLKGPSTGLDFRGRPQAIAADAQPAMLRGLLTLRLSKPTRIRKIEIKLEGKTKTEWPEGIGPRRMDTHEEHIIMSEKTTYFNAIKSEQSSDMRRTASVGPGISMGQFDADEQHWLDSETTTPAEYDTGEYFEGNGARQDRFGTGQIPRSASAMPGSSRGEWAGTNASSRQSIADDDDGALHIRDLSLRDRGPSPAYTPRAESVHAEGSRRSGLRNQALTAQPILSPIPSAPASRAASDRTDSTSTERRRQQHAHVARSSLAGEPLPEDVVMPREEDESETLLPTPDRPSILENAGHRHGSGEVRFAETVFSAPAPEPAAESGNNEHHAINEEHQEVDDDEPAATVDLSEPTTSGARQRRTASIRTLDSTFSASSTSLSGSGHGHAPVHDVHPVNSAIRTAANSPMHSAAPSPAPSIRAHPSVENLARQTSGSSAVGTPPGEMTRRSSANASGNESSRRSSLLGRESAVPTPAAPSASSTVAPSPGTATPPNQEIRKGKRTKVGNPSTIIINKDMPGPSRPSESRQESGRSVSSSSGMPSLLQNHRDHSSYEDERQHRHLKFSLANALGAVKTRMASKSRSRADSRNASRGPSRAPSRSASRAPSIDEGSRSMSRVASGSGYGTVNGVGSAVPSYLQDEERSNRFAGNRGHSTDEFGRSSGRSRSTDRTASPARQRDGERSPSRNRGRHKGMKVLTGALDGKHQEEDGEHLHNWKEFRKGVYNYPISFPIPVNAPPTLHAEFGSVVYRLKASVVRVGALTSNLVEDVEVTMIATPQEDDLEETENVIVERQWEEQMRYQIALHGKAFPIGGIIPISLRIMPLMKCKIHRLTVALEEKTDYFAQEKKVARHETPKKFTLLFVKQPDRFERQFPLLPIISDDPNAAKESPVAQLAAQAAVNNPSPDAFDPTDEDSIYAPLYDPMGPWHLEKSLQLPDCTTSVKFTTKHEKTNITVGHWMKVTIRVERGDDVAVDSKGRRKQFDIIIETPIKILDCRVNPQINSLPTYTAVHPLANTAPGVCAIHSAHGKHSAPIASQKHIDPLVASAPSGMARTDQRAESSSGQRGRRDRDGHHHGNEEDTLLERNIVYDRLMSGQETETGDTPPTYGEAVASAIRNASRSASAMGREGSTGDIMRGREGVESRSRSRLRD